MRLRDEIASEIEIEILRLPNALPLRVAPPVILPAFLGTTSCTKNVFTSVSTRLSTDGDWG